MARGELEEGGKSPEIQEKIREDRKGDGGSWLVIRDPAPARPRD